MHSVSVRLLIRFGVLCLAALPGAHSRAATPSVLDATLDLNEPFRPGVSLLWSPTGQAAWDALREYHKVDAIEMAPRSVTAEKLNAFKWDKASVLPVGTVIFSGDDSEAFREKIRTELRKRIGEPAAAMIGPYKPPAIVQVEPLIVRIKSAIMVSAIGCKPRFPVDFQLDFQPKLFTNSAGQQIKALGFGATRENAAEYNTAVRALEDNLAGSFSVRLAFFTNDEQNRECLVLTTGANHKNLEEVLVHVRGLLQKGRIPEKVVESNGRKWRYMDTLARGDLLWLPHLKASQCCDYLDLIGRKYLEDEKARTWWEIREATQLLNVGLDHKGALVQSVFKIVPDFLAASGEGKKESLPQPQEPLPVYPKTFIFDKPFVASLWREGADWPYLALWVDGPEMLTLAK